MADGLHVEDDLGLGRWNESQTSQERRAQQAAHGKG
jgi:hypothetical protein